MSQLISVETCFSTNDEIINYLAENQTDIIGLYTSCQTKGRGQYGNSWNIRPNENLALSIAVPVAQIHPEIIINFYTAVLIRDFIAKLTDEDTKIKWPNDIILKEKKICGILIERKKIADVHYFIIGIGININQTDFQDLKNVGSLFTQTGKRFSIDDVSKCFFTFFEEHIFRIPDLKTVLRDFNRHLFRKDQISVFEKDGLRQNGIVKEMDENGFLWIDLETEGLQKFFHKEIQMLY